MGANSQDSSQVISRRFTASSATEQANGYRYENYSAQRPIKVFDNGELLAEYAYNGFGERIKKVVYRGDQKRVTYFLYDGHQLTAEIDGESDTYKQGVFLEDFPVAYLLGRDVYAVHADHLGTPRVVTDEKVETVWSADYDPFGHATITTDADLAGDTVDGSSGSNTTDTAATVAETAGFDLPYRLPGQYFDAETGTHYNYLRDYDPGTGRYVTSDPIGLQGGLNTYAYALNDPLGLSDPLGLTPNGIGLAAGQRAGNGADSPDKPSAGDASEEAYTDKLKRVLDYAIKDMEKKVANGDATEASLRLLNNMLAEVAVVAAILAAVALVPGAAAVIAQNNITESMVTRNAELFAEVLFEHSLGVDMESSSDTTLVFSPQSAARK